MGGEILLGKEEFIKTKSPGSGACQHKLKLKLTLSNAPVTAKPLPPTPPQKNIHYRSKVSWHSILDPCENRVENRDSILDLCVLILDSQFLRDLSNRNGLFVYNQLKGFCFEWFALYSRYSIAARIYNLCSNFSHVKKIFLLQKITNSTQRLILAINSRTTCMQIIQ